MSRRGSSDDEANEINLTPMLDVVFIMLIFFIVTASFIKESGLDVLRPEAVTAPKIPDANIFVAIGENNEIWMDRQQVDPRLIRGKIEAAYAENPKGSLVIQADRKSNNKTLKIVMNAARAAGVENVSVAADNPLQ